MPETEFTAEERAAMKGRAKELRTASKRGKSSKADGEADLLAAIEEMPPEDRAMAERIHALVQKNAPGLVPRTWYGQPAWATQAGKVVCFFQATAKFKTRYATFGFNEPANLDDGTMWATAFALLDLSAADEKKLGALIKKAAS